MEEHEWATLLQLTNETSQPNLTQLALRLRDLDAMALNLKFFGYDLARQLANDLPVRTDLKPKRVRLKSKASTQADMESDWVAYWCGQLKVPVVFHRKLWELSYMLQALWERGLLKAGNRGLGFGCGTEPLPSYLASHGIDVTVTDLAPEESIGRGWANTNQHTATLNHAFKKNLVSRDLFERHVSLAYVDMNDIPPTLRDYDFCWSICSLEHLGSIAQGLDFIQNSIDTLKPGGVAVHTTEFNFLNEDKTVDNWPTVLFQRKHFIEIAQRLRELGHEVAELNFDVGDKPLDRFIDLPPWRHDMQEHVREMWGHGHTHLKLSIDGFVCTCYGLIIRKAV
ncbi:SAM-dependent methyltransferase [Xanthobacteraceae bacterium A53D]